MGIARRRGGEGVAAAGDGEGSRVFADQAAACGLSSCSGSSSSLTLRSPASSGLTDDGGEVTSTSPRNGGDCSFSSSESELESEEEEMMPLDGDGHTDGGGGPLYELTAPLLEQLPLRTGLSKYYQGKSQSFTSLCNARCVEDLAKKTTPYITRMNLQLHRGHGVGLVVEFASRSRALQLRRWRRGHRGVRPIACCQQQGALASLQQQQQQQQNACTPEQERAVKMLVKKKAIQGTAKWRGGFSPEMNSSAISTLLHWS